MLLHPAGVSTNEPDTAFKTIDQAVTERIRGGVLYRVTGPLLGPRRSRLNV